MPATPTLTPSLADGKSRSPFQAMAKPESERIAAGLTKQPLHPQPRI